MYQRTLHISLNAFVLLNLFHTRSGQNPTSVSDAIEVDIGVDIKCKFKVTYMFMCLCKMFRANGK